MNNKTLNTLFSALLSQVKASRSSAYMGSGIADPLARRHNQWLSMSRSYSASKVSATLKLTNASSNVIIDQN